MQCIMCVMYMLRSKYIPCFVLSAYVCAHRSVFLHIPYQPYTLPRMYGRRRFDMSSPLCDWPAYRGITHQNPVAEDCDGPFRRLRADTYLVGGYCCVRVLPPSVWFIFVKTF